MPTACSQCSVFLLRPGDETLLPAAPTARPPVTPSAWLGKGKPQARVPTRATSRPVAGQRGRALGKELGRLPFWQPHTHLFPD